MEKSVQTAGVAAPPDHKTPPGPWAVAIGHWINDHKNITDNLVGYTGYQVLRSAAAAVPYGISMPVTYYGLLKLGQAGQSIEEAGKLAGSAFQSALGMNMHKFASARPVMLSAMIGTSFTCYRGTSKLGNWTKQHLFDKNDTPEQSVEKVQYYWSDLGNKFREIAPAEINSTPLAAIVLGFMAAAFDPTKVPPQLKWSHANFKKAQAEGRSLGMLKDVIMHPDARFLEHAAINTIGYSLFFELGDRLFKDVQVRRRLWQGDPNNISNKGGSADPSAALVDDEAQEKQRIINKYGSELHHGEVKRPGKENKKYGFFTDEPSLGRFAFRRVLPTALGISAYTAFKFRHAYMLVGDFPDLKKAADIPKNIKREGLAVTLFFLIPWVADPWSRFYDQFFEKLEKKGKGETTASSEPQAKNIIANNELLLQKLNGKEHGASI